MTMAVFLRRCRIIRLMMYDRCELMARKKAIECCADIHRLSTSSALKDSGLDDEWNKEELRSDATVSLLGTDNKPMGTMALAHATKLAMAKGLKLVRLQDRHSTTTATTSSPVFKLMTSGEVQHQRITQNDKAKDGKASKSISLMTRIADHDLSTKTSAIKKWLAKGHSVQVTITLATPNSPPQDLERVFKAVESSTKPEGRVLQKREKGGVMKFNLQPQPPEEQ